MPIYEYSCAACGHAFEEWQKMSDPPVRTCPKCKKKKVEKLISHTAFQLKGGGWYADLYSSSKAGGQKTDGKESGSGSKQDSSDGGEQGKASKDGKGSSDGGASQGGAKATDSGPAASKKDNKGDAKDAKKKDSPKKSEARAA
jgi:putative FmdB family regulatory protein